MHSQIYQFWTWFSKNQEQFKKIKNPVRVRDLLDNQILVFGKLSWGIDEVKNNKYAFTISPNGDKKLLFLTKKIVDLAPTFPDWEFNYCKPPELDWDFQFKMFNNYLLMQNYDAAEWQFVLIEEEDYRIRVEVKVSNLEGLDIEEQVVAANMAVTKLLGEELRIEEVHSVTLTHQFDPRDKEWIYPMRQFRRRFLDFIE